MNYCLLGRKLEGKRISMKKKLQMLFMLKKMVKIFLSRRMLIK
nr:MAG TPA: hypothetical protein [Caudoviricetes sp.]